MAGQRETGRYAVLAGVGLGIPVMSAMGMVSEPVITLFVAILAGFAARFAFRFMIIFSTAFSGAGGMVYGIACLTVRKRKYGC